MVVTAAVVVSAAAAVATAVVPATEPTFGKEGTVMSHKDNANRQIICTYETHL